MRFYVDVRYTVKYIDPDDMVGDGVRKERRQIAGPLEAESEAAGRVGITKLINNRHVGCWALEINKITIYELDEAAGLVMATEILAKAVEQAAGLKIPPEQILAIVGEALQAKA